MCVNITHNDADLLGSLMFESYHNTIDDEGETPAEATEEIQQTLSGKYGPILETCSFLVEEQDRALSATIVSWWQGVQHPFLLFAMTDPQAQRQGLSRFLLKRSINALLAAGYSDLSLAVTIGNIPAQKLYESIGFQVVREQ